LFAFVFKAAPQAAPVKISVKELIFSIDIPGILLLLATLVCFFLALEWGGVTKPWNSSSVIGIIIGCGLLLIAFILVEWRSGERAILVPRILRNRTMAACAALIFL